MEIYEEVANFALELGMSPDFVLQSVSWAPLILFIFFLFLYSFVSLAVSALDNLFLFRSLVIRCEGFHSGKISGPCHCRRCPYSKQCAFYAPWPSLIQRLRMYLVKKKEP